MQLKVLYNIEINMHQVLQWKKTEREEDKQDESGKKNSLNKWKLNEKWKLNKIWMIIEYRECITEIK